MKNILKAAVVSTSLLGATFAAFAGEAKGVVASVDTATKTVILEDGSTWTAGDGVDVSTLVAGDAIKVTFTDGTTMLTAVEKM
ncbi:MAG: DUF1344 domain-containing protein [Ahrensia sp.]|nr:DUF1344 domain-containing protein [Ahrensia sp.]